MINMEQVLALRAYKPTAVRQALMLSGLDDELVAVCPACYGKGKPRRLDPGHVLPNGGIVLAYKNDATDPAILGKVLVFLPNNDFHPFATWTYNWRMLTKFRTVNGSYFETLAAAAESFGLEVSNV